MASRIRLLMLGLAIWWVAAAAASAAAADPGQRQQRQQRRQQAGIPAAEEQAAGRLRRSLLLQDDGHCPRPTLFLLSGIGGSQFIGTQAGGGPCFRTTTPKQVWFNFFLNLNLQCFGEWMGLEYEKSTGRFVNSTGSQLWADEGGPSGSQQGTLRVSFYGALFAHLKAKHGYVEGRDLFWLPYDWRVGVKQLDETGGFAALAAKVAAGTARNCGRRAVILSHSYGANVGMAMLHSPGLAAWRAAHVAGFIALGGPWSGAAATGLMTKLAGDYSRMWPALSNAAAPAIEASGSLLGPGPYERALYRLATANPTFLTMSPAAPAFADDFVIVTTPSRNYTVAQQRELMLAQGDEGAASVIGPIQEAHRSLLAKGPVPGVETYCVYATGVLTPARLVFEKDVRPKTPLPRPARVDSVPGDGSVDLKSLRLCSAFAPASHLVEVDNPVVDHTSLISNPIGLEAISGVLVRLGAPRLAGSVPL